MDDSRNSVEIREAKPEDFPALAVLMTELGYPTSEDQMRDRMNQIHDDDSLVTLLAELDGEVVAMAGIEFSRAYEKDGIYARLVALVVGSEVRGRGIGKTMLDSCESLAREVGAESLMLNSHLRREDAHRFYESQEYEKTGFRFIKPLDES